MCLFFILNKKSYQRVCDLTPISKKYYRAKISKNYGLFKGPVEVDATGGSVIAGRFQNAEADSLGADPSEADNLVLAVAVKLVISPVAGEVFPIGGDFHPHPQRPAIPAAGSWHVDQLV